MRMIALPKIQFLMRMMMRMMMLRMMWRMMRIMVKLDKMTINRKTLDSLVLMPEAIEMMIS
jgi:hypothetical protein